jgi:3-polyprenyl-4-hydroxybenzoate decarboxylase
MSQFDLREWLRAAGAAGELQHISGADAVLEIGAASELNYRRLHPRALLFDEIAGYRPGRRVFDYSYMRSVMKSAMATDALASAGLPGVSAVWCHEAGGGRSIIVVGLEQRYAGHSRQAGYLAAQLPVTACMNRLVITVDADVDPRDLHEVMWAVSIRCDPARDIDIMRYSWGCVTDPLSLPGEPTYNSRALIDACRPFERLADFPAVAETSRAVLARVAGRWPELAS